MRMLLFIIMLLIPAQSYAVGECLEYRKEIMRDIGNLNNCWKDEDCGYEWFGCPWDGKCYPSKVNKNEKDKITMVREKIESFETCIRKDKMLKENCEKQITKEAPMTCVPPKLLCVNGKCMNHTQIITQSEEEGEDIYGSRKIYVHPEEESE